MSSIVNAISSLGSTITNFFSSVMSILNYIYSMFKALRYGLTSLLTGTWELVVQVFDGGVFSTVGTYFNYLAGYIGYPAVIFMSTLFLFIIFRIGVSFVFKLLRMNINYYSLNSKSRTRQQHSQLKK